MAGVTVHLHNEKPPRAIVMQQQEDGRRWICCYLDDVSLFLHGYDIDAAMDARALAAQLTTAADEIEAAIQRDADAKLAAVAGKEGVA